MGLLKATLAVFMCFGPCHFLCPICGVKERVGFRLTSRYRPPEVLEVWTMHTQVTNTSCVVVNNAYLQKHHSSRHRTDTVE